MPRILFEKVGSAVWISHLDLMRLFQRSFKRAGLPLKHTQGYNPRPFVSIALPLSVGVESICELLDFELDGGEATNEQILQGLNDNLVPGIRMLQIIDNGRKIKDLAFLEALLTLEYDALIPAGAVKEIGELFGRDSLTVTKKSKNGEQEQDIIPMIRKCHVSRADDHNIQINAIVCCQNPSLNPLQLTAAIGRYLPQYQPDFVKCCRMELYDTKQKIFR